MPPHILLLCDQSAPPNQQTERVIEGIQSRDVSVSACDFSNFNTFLSQLQQCDGVVFCLIQKSNRLREISGFISQAKKYLSSTSLNNKLASAYSDSLALTKESLQPILEVSLFCKSCQMTWVESDTLCQEEQKRHVNETDPFFYYGQAMAGLAAEHCLECQS